MKHRMLSLGALIAVIGSATAYGVLAQGTPPPTPPPTGSKHEAHPEMTKARKQLQNAKATLQKAAKDYSGHRVKAMDLIDQAIKEIDAGIASDKS
ncbi:MAG TPA: hypothetical protein VKU00_11905 [Chthonomonadaceae bacterium]|nr:hypothetical protein [Chthonomonadaceae bacterium]